jgi:hypothetical protein
MATMSPSLVAALSSHSAADRPARDLGVMSERTGATRRQTTRRTRGCSKHAFAPSARFRPRNGASGNVTLPAQGHFPCPHRGRFASGIPVANDNPVNEVDPTGMGSFSLGPTSEGDLAIGVGALTGIIALLGVLTVIGTTLSVVLGAAGITAVAALQLAQNHGCTTTVNYSSFLGVPVGVTSVSIHGCHG